MEHVLMQLQRLQNYQVVPPSCPSDNNYRNCIWHEPNQSTDSPVHEHTKIENRVIEKLMELVNVLGKETKRTEKKNISFSKRKMFSATQKTIKSIPVFS